MTNNTILVVDDDKIICKVLTSLLEQEGYRTETAYSGEDALECLKTVRYLAVITDLKMKRVDGFEVTRFCKQTAPETRVIMITGCSDEQHKKTAYLSGASSFLIKPFDIDELLDSLPPKVPHETSRAVADAERTCPL